MASFTMQAWRLLLVFGMLQSHIGCFGAEAPATEMMEGNQEGFAQSGPAAEKFQWSGDPSLVNPTDKSQKMLTSPQVTKHVLPNRSKYEKKKIPPIPLPTVSKGQLPSSTNISTQDYGTGGIPYTTSGAYALETAAQTFGLPTAFPSNLMPWSATGKLSWDFGWCSASMISPHVAVTAAHCVSDFGSNQIYPGDAFFVASEFGASELYVARVDLIYAPTTYLDGSDECLVEGIVCENDVAILVLEPIQSPSEAVGESPGKYGGYLNFTSSDEAYVADFGGDPGQKATQITELGFPFNLDSGTRMARTDSIGFQTEGNQVEIGSGMRGGSSGGPWIVNFGTQANDDASSSYGFDIPNAVVATTSWGYIDEEIKIQGASRFSTNAAFPEKSNIQSLIDDYCCALGPTARESMCGDIATCEGPAINSLLGARSSGRVEYKEDITSGSFVRIPGTMKSVSLSGRAAVGVQYSGRIYHKEDITSGSWVRIPGTMQSVSLSGRAAAGLGTEGGRIYYKEDITSGSWVRIPTSGLTMYSVSLSGRAVAGVDSNGQTYYKEDITSGSWVSIPGSIFFSSVSLSGRAVVGVDFDRRIYYKEDITTGSWVRIPGSLNYGEGTVSLSGRAVVGVKESGAIYYKEDITTGSWVRIPGSLQSVSLSSQAQPPSDPLQFVLSWDNAASDTDLDLWVSYNLQSECTISYQNPGSSVSPVCGGYLSNDVTSSPSGTEVTTYNTPASGTYYVAIDPYTFSGTANVQLTVNKNGVATTLLPSSPATSAPLPTCPSPYTTFYEPTGGECLGFTVSFP